MGYSFSIEKKRFYLHTLMSGAYTLDRVRGYLQSIRESGFREHVSDVLIEHRLERSPLDRFARDRKLLRPAPPASVPPAPAHQPAGWVPIGSPTGRSTSHERTCAGLGVTIQRYNQDK